MTTRRTKKFMSVLMKVATKSTQNHLTLKPTIVGTPARNRSYVNGQSVTGNSADRMSYLDMEGLTQVTNLTLVVYVNVDSQGQTI